MCLREKKLPDSSGNVLDREKKKQTVHEQGYLREKGDKQRIVRESTVENSWGGEHTGTNLAIIKRVGIRKNLG